MIEEEITEIIEEEEIVREKVFYALAGQAGATVDNVTEHMLEAIPGWLGDFTANEHLAFRTVFKLLSSKRELTTKARQVYKALKPAAIPGVTFSLVVECLERARSREKAILDDFLYLMGGGELPEIKRKVLQREPSKIKPAISFDLPPQKLFTKEDEERYQNDSHVSDDPTTREATFFTALIVLHESKTLDEIYEYYRERQKPPDDIWDFYSNLRNKNLGMTNRQLKDAYFLANRRARKLPPMYLPLTFYNQNQKIPSSLPKAVGKRYMRISPYVTQEAEEEDEELKREEKRLVGIYCAKSFFPDENESKCPCSSYLNKTIPNTVETGCACNKYLCQKSDEKAVHKAIDMILSLGGAIARLPDIHLLFKKPNINNLRKLNIIRLKEKIEDCDDAQFDEPNRTSGLYKSVCRDVVKHVKPRGGIGIRLPVVREGEIVYTFLPYMRKEKDKVMTPLYEDMKKFKVMSTWANYKSEVAEKLPTNAYRRNTANVMDTYGATTVRKADVKAPLYYGKSRKVHGHMKEKEPVCQNL